MKCKVIISMVAIALLATTAASAAPLIKSGLSLYYSFDAIAGTGTSVADGSGNGYDGTIVGNVVHESGVTGGAARFFTDGVDILRRKKTVGAQWNYVELPAANMMTGNDVPTSGMTIALWYNTTNTLSTYSNPDNLSNFNQATLCPQMTPVEDQDFQIHAEIRDRSDDSSNEDYYRLTLRDDNVDTIGTLEAGIGNASEGPNWDEWTHLAFTFEQNGTMTVYENGTVVDSMNTVLGTAISDDWGVGAFVGCNTDLDRQFLGVMDEFYLYNRALSESEIQVLVEGPAAGDVNCDGKVDGSDVTILANNWQKGVGDGVLATWEMGDFNGDNKVDGSDVTILANNWQDGVSSIGAAVPEPSTVVLLLGAIVGLLVTRRRK